MQRLEADEVAELYIPDGSVDYPHADGHFNEAGNAWVAAQLSDVIRELLPGP